MKVDRYHITLPGERHLVIANDGKLTVVTPRFAHLRNRTVKDLLAEIKYLGADFTVESSDADPS